VPRRVIQRNYHELEAVGVYHTSMARIGKYTNASQRIDIGTNYTNKQVAARHIKDRPVPHCRVLPPGKINGMITDLLPVHSVSFCKHFPKCCKQTNIIINKYCNKVIHTFASDAFSVSSPTLWNNLPQDVQSCANQATFKSRLKSYLFSLAFTV